MHEYTQRGQKPETHVPPYRVMSYISYAHARSLLLQTSVYMFLTLQSHIILLAYKRITAT